MRKRRYIVSVQICRPVSDCHNHRMYNGTSRNSSNFLQNGLWHQISHLRKSRIRFSFVCWNMFMAVGKSFKFHRDLQSAGALWSWTKMLRSNSKLFSRCVCSASRWMSSYWVHWFQELSSKVGIALDAWTSSNQFAFLAIVVHYVTNDWRHGRCWLWYLWSSN